MKDLEGKVVTIERICGDNTVGIEESEYYFDKRAFEPLNIKPTKDELLKLPIGTKITTDNDEYNVFLKTGEDVFRNDDSDVLVDYDINDDLTINDEDLGTRIIKVEVPTYETEYDSSGEVKEMTIAEISKALGYEVKIIKEDK
jgi:hypothetical protein